MKKASTRHINFKSILDYWLIRPSILMDNLHFFRQSPKVHCMTKKSDDGTSARIGVLGDLGYDTYAYYMPDDGGAVDSRLARRVSWDINVPSGAGFLYECLGTFRNTTGKDGYGLDFIAPIPDTVKNRKDNNGSLPWLKSTDVYLYFLEKYEENHRINQLVELKVVDADESPASTTLETQSISASDYEKFSVIKSYEKPSSRTKLHGQDPTVDPKNYKLLVVHDGGGEFRDLRFENGGEDNSAYLSFIKQFLDRDLHATSPRLIVNLFGSAPDFTCFPKPPENGKAQGFWNLILGNEDYAKQVCVVCSATPLRRAGAAISRRLSLEQTVEDLATEMKLFPTLRKLSEVAHLVIRFGVSGIVHLYNDPRTQHRAARLHFVPLARDGIVRDQASHGRIVGKNALIVSGIVHGLYTAGPNESANDTLKDVLNGTLAAMIRAFTKGYQRDLFSENSSGSKEIGPRLIRDLCLKAFDYKSDDSAEAPANGDRDTFSDGSPPAIRLGQSELLRIEEDGSPSSSTQRIGYVAVPNHVLDHPRGSLYQTARGWHILSEALEGSGYSTTDEQAGNASRINLAIAICRFGLNKVFNRTKLFSETFTREERSKEEDLLYHTLRRPACRLNDRVIGDEMTLAPEELPEFPNLAETRPDSGPETLNPVYVPVIRFNNLTTVERSEIESFRSIRNLIKTYMETDPGSSPIQGKPVSIAVFGPPGSGKSFGVREIVNSVNESRPAATRKLQFLEFNVSQFRGVEDLGEALKRVASVNNDGKMPLVFFDEFDASFNKDQLYWLKYFLAPMQDGSFFDARQQIKLGRAIFVFAGGIYGSFEEFDPFPPAGVEQAETSAEKRDAQQLFRQQKGPDFISRLRGHINILGLNAKAGQIKPVIRRAILIRSLIESNKLTIDEQESGLSIIDEDILYGMLTIDRFRHGARSVTAILQMCTEHDQRIDKSSLPSRSQLNMHVDANEFFIRVFRSRSRSRYANTTVTPPKAPAEQDIQHDAGDS